MSHFHAKLQLRNFLLWHPELEDDSKQIAIESETDFLEIVEDSLDRIAIMEARMDRLHKRFELWEERKEREKKQLLELMQITGSETARSDSGTVSIGYAPESVLLDGKDFPPRFMRSIPNKDEIKQYLKEGGKLQGAVLSNNRQPYLKIRTK